MRATGGQSRGFRDVWSYQAVADALYACCGERVSRSTVRRVLGTEGFRPHRARCWLHSPDPDFRAKVARVCRPYTHPPKDAVVLCVDEKPMQALARRHPTRVGPRGVVRHEFEYGSFESLHDVARDVLGFIRHWNRHEAHPFRWTFAGRFVDPPAPLAA